MRHLTATPEEAAAGLAGCERIGVDTETTGLDPRSNRVRLVQLASEENTYLVDVFQYPDLEPLRPLLADPNVRKIFQNAVFDMSFLKQQHDLDVVTVVDTMIAAGLCGFKELGLKSLARILIGEIIEKESQTSDWSMPRLTEQQLEYAARDAEILIPIWRELSKKLSENKLGRVARLEFDVLHAVTQLQLNGLGFNAETCAELRDETQRKRDKFAAEFKGMLPGEKYSQLTLMGEVEINMNSHPQLVDALGKAGVQVDSTKVEVLEKVKGEHPLAAKLLEYRKEEKLLNSFLVPYPEKVSKVTGRIHPNFNQIRVRTGRFSASSPNVQQLTREGGLRELIEAAPGNVLISSDYEQQELRVLADLSRDEAMQEAFSTGIDLHSNTYSVMRHVPVEEVTKEQRTVGKMLAFGLLYGMSAPGLARRMNISKDEAIKLMKDFFGGYPGIGEWTRKVQRRGAQDKFVRSIMGRKVLLDSKDGREAVNYTIQSSSADMTKLAMCYAVENGLKLVNVVHDELVIEHPEDDAEGGQRRLEEAMLRAGNDLLEVVESGVDSRISRVWGK